jgi:DnaJ-class molecular chaperone
MPRQSRPEQHGDLLAEVHAALPQRLSVEQRRLMEQFALTESSEPVSAGGGTNAT